MNERERFHMEEQDGTSNSLNPVTNLIESGQEEEYIHTLLKRIRFTIDLLENNPDICNPHYDQYITDLVTDSHNVQSLHNNYCLNHRR